MSESSALGLSRKNIALYVLLMLIAFAIPPLLCMRKLPFISDTYGETFLAFELLGATVGAALLIITYIELKKRWHDGFPNMLPVFVFCLVCFHFLIWICECPQAGDFKAFYIPAAHKVLAGEDPYTGTGYLYPPLVAECLAVGYDFLGCVAEECGFHITPYQNMGMVFYIYECLQLCLAVLAYFLSVRFVRSLGADSIWIYLLVGAVFTFNNPLIRVFRFGQMNLWLVNAILLVLVAGRRYVAASGLLLGTAVHVKVYPIIMVPALIVAKRWRQLAWFAVAAVGIFMLDTRFCTSTETWEQYLRRMPTFPHMVGVFRDNSLHNVVSHTVRFLRIPHGQQATSLLLALASMAVLLWVGLRFLKREKSFRWSLKSIQSQDDRTAAQHLRFCGLSLDLVSASLILSPMVWEHHYVLAIPMILWAIVVHHRRRSLLCGAGSMLILLPPTFDIFPFSYHRLVGLIILMIAVSPVVNIQEYRQNIEDFQAVDNQCARVPDVSGTE